MATGLLIGVALVVSLLFGLPLFVIMGLLAGICYVNVSGETLSVVVGDIFYAADKEILLAIPLFVLAGQIMTKGTISTRLINVARSLTAGIPGGMGIAAILSCGVFAAISGSSPVTLIAIGSLMYPALLEAGYSKKLATGALATGGTLGIIIPPSIPMIIFAIMAGVSVVDLFKAGIGPGILLVVLLSGYMFYARPRVHASVFSLPAFLADLRRGIFSILMPVIILGGIYTGFFTATESAAIAVLYAVLVEFLIHRELAFGKFLGVFRETAEMLGMLFLILILAVSLNKFMTFEQIPQLMVETMSSLISSKVTFLVAVNLLLLVVGCFMDVMSAILVLAPILTPMAVHYGISPIHFGVVMIVNLEIGYLTPPIGINLFVASGIFKQPIVDVIRAVVPFLFVMLLGLALISFIPAISLSFV
jgi:C4-dicarboxylate transporter DctM subunit